MIHTYIAIIHPYMVNSQHTNNFLIAKYHVIATRHSTGFYNRKHLKCV